MAHAICVQRSHSCERVFSVIVPQALRRANLRLCLLGDRRRHWNGQFAARWRLRLPYGNVRILPFNLVCAQAFWAEIPPVNRPHRLAAMHRLAPSPGNPVQHKPCPNLCEEISNFTAKGFWPPGRPGFRPALPQIPNRRRRKPESLEIKKYFHL